MNQEISIILITGMPGVGKTTAIKKLCSSLAEKSIKCFGFYTEEVRHTNGERIGFDIVNFNGNRDVLARCSNSDIRRPKVGKYSVHVEQLERLALPCFDQSIDNKSFLIIDEIGKMELFSKKFEMKIKNLITQIKADKVKVIATIPSQNRPLKIVEEIRSLPNSKLFEIKKGNRNEIYNEIENFCINVLQ